MSPFAIALSALPAVEGFAAVRRLILVLLAASFVGLCAALAICYAAYSAYVGMAPAIGPSLAAAAVSGGAVALGGIVLIVLIVASRRQDEFSPFQALQAAAVADPLPTVISVATMGLMAGLSLRR